MPHRTLILTLLPTLALAHFTILYPPTIFLLAGEAPITPPCGYTTSPNTSTTPRPFLISGSQIALSTHGDASWTIQYTLDAVPAAAGGGNWSDLVRPLETEGNGNFCIPNAQARGADLGDEGQREGWISVSASMEEGVSYQCAFVNFAEVGTLEFPTICANSSGVSVRFAGEGGSTISSRTATPSSTRYANSTTTKTAESTEAGTTTISDTDTSSLPIDAPPSSITAEPTGGDSGGDSSDGGGGGGGGPNTITSTSFVSPTGGAGASTVTLPSGTASPSPGIAIPTGAATNIKGSPLGVKGFGAVVLGAGILCAGLMM